MMLSSSILICMLNILALTITLSLTRAQFNSRSNRIGFCTGIVPQSVGSSDQRMLRNLSIVIDISLKSFPDQSNLAGLSTKRASSSSSQNPTDCFDGTRYTAGYVCDKTTARSSINHDSTGSARQPNNRITKQKQSYGANSASREADSFIMFPGKTPLKRGWL